MEQEGLKELIEVDVQIPHGAKQIHATVTHPIGHWETRTAVILTHGAGGDKDFHQLVKLSNHLAQNGFLCLRFTCKGLNLGYRIKVYNSVIKFLRNHREYKVDRCIVGGRSMGARAAVGVSLLESEEFANFIHGILCLSYPLHSQDNVKNLRDEPLLVLKKPVLFISGTCDEMCKKNLMERTMRKMTCEVKKQWIANANHGLKDVDILSDVCEHARHWCKQIDGNI